MPRLAVAILGLTGRLRVLMPIGSERAVRHHRFVCRPLASRRTKRLSPLWGLINSRLDATGSASEMAGDQGNDKNDRKRYADQPKKT